MGTHEVSQRCNVTRGPAELKAALLVLAGAARDGLERWVPTFAPEDLFATFPRGTCGPVSELMGRIVVEQLGIAGVYVCGSNHPTLRPAQAHAWVEVEELIIDLTYDQFPRTGLSGWVFEASPWHTAFSRESQALCLNPKFWGEYPYAAYGAMSRSCDEAKRRGLF